MRDQEAAARVTDLRAAAPTLTTARPTTAEGADVVREIVQAGISARSDTRLELRLDPPELGKINIDFDFSEERISIVVRAEREEALDLMRRHSEELLRSFRSSGLDLGSLDFARGGSRQHDDQQNRSSVTGHNYATTTDTVAAPHIAVANDRLDIRI